MEISLISTLIIGFYVTTVIGILLIPVVICVSCVFVLLYYLCKKYFGDKDVYKFFIANYQQQRKPDIRLEVTNSSDQLTDNLIHASPCKRDKQGRFPKSPIFKVEDSEGRQHDNLRFYY